jgi:hypothetical protein
VSPAAGCTPASDLRTVPRRLRYRQPEISDDLRAIRTHAGVLIYETTIGASGEVTEVRLAKPVDSREPWPTLARLWREAILDWRYEPTVVNGEPAAVCMHVTVTIDVM